jgi:hypothetical protein
MNIISIPVSDELRTGLWVFRFSKVKDGQSVYLINPDISDTMEETGPWFSDKLDYRCLFIGTLRKVRQLFLTIESEIDTKFVFFFYEICSVDEIMIQWGPESMCEFAGKPATTKTKTEEITVNVDYMCTLSLRVGND